MRPTAPTFVRVTVPIHEQQPRRSPRPRLAAMARLLAAGALLAAPSLPWAQPAVPTAASAATATLTTPSGITIVTLRDGGGAQPTASDTVTVHYRGVLANGSEFDSSYKRNQPTSFPLDRVIPCWTEGVQHIKVGGKARLTCPPALAYGERGAGGGLIPPNATLTFEIELLSIGRR